MRSRVLSHVLVGGLVLAASVAAVRPAAARDKIVVFALEEVKLEAKDRPAAARFVELMRRAAVKAGGDLTVPPMGLFDVLVALDCPDVVPECLIEVAKHFKVRLVAYGTVTRKKGKLAVKLNLFDATAMKMRGAIENEVKGRGPKELAHDFDLLAGRLFRGAEAAPPGGNLVVSSMPGDATVELNGVIKGLTPLKLDGLAPGDYSIELTKPGFVRSVARVRIDSGETAKVDLLLRPAERPPVAGAKPTEKGDGAAAKPPGPRARRPPPPPPPPRRPAAAGAAPRGGGARPGAPPAPARPPAARGDRPARGRGHRSRCRPAARGGQAAAPGARADLGPRRDRGGAARRRGRPRLPHRPHPARVR